MGRAVLLGSGLAFIFAMIVIAWHVVYVGVQATTEGDVQFLEAAANTQYGYFSFRSRSNQFKRNGVALGVGLHLRISCPAIFCAAILRAEIVLRLNVAGAAGQKESVAQVEPTIRGKFVAGLF